ncbi:hypothetical protein E4U42_000741 [Claviceps africana]|uniref:Uncharacterized protein n=1 Tax=Claviceps africana TaxID=83212 RepID=A0A8K0NE63_9HYPO|nr:hypothetical protein E4U42_000741 [Claviceps africana]
MAATSRPAPSSPLPRPSIPPALRPLVRAYLLAYASAVLPRLAALILRRLPRRKRKQPDYAPPPHPPDQNLSAACLHVLKTALQPRRFPAFCAALVGGSTLLQVRLSLGPGPRRASAAFLWLT